MTNYSALWDALALEALWSLARRSSKVLDTHWERRRWAASTHPCQTDIRGLLAILRATGALMVAFPRAEAQRLDRGLGDEHLDVYSYGA
jgi:hypothetical protein